MKLLPIAAGVFLGVSALHAQTDDAAFLAKFESTFETPDTVAVKDFVSESLMNGRLHRVRPLATNDGLRNTYYVDSPSGVQEITGTPALEARIWKFTRPKAVGMANSSASAVAPSVTTIEFRMKGQ